MTEKGSTKADKIGDDKSINFRTSPNFIHMKKYLISKYEEAECSASALLSSQIPDQGNNLANQSQEKKNNVVVQPPLPPNTPPPDYPPQFVLKKEVMDDGYEINMQPKNEEQKEEHDTKPTIQNEVVVDKPKKKEMCRDFARGNCQWNPCNKSHEIDLSQLEGVYDFCKDYANGKCKRPNCRFVHATTFEKESFFRTGYLPEYLRPKIRSKRDALVAQSQAQPVQQQQPLLQNPQHIKQIHMSSSQPMSLPMYPPMVESSPEYHASGAPVAAAMPPSSSLVAAIDPNLAYNIFVPPQPPASPPQPAQGFEFGNINTQAEEAMVKNCAKCKLGEIRYLENLMELEKVEESTKTLKEQIGLLDQKKAKFLAVLTKVLWKDMPK